MVSTTRMSRPVKARYAQVSRKIGYQEDALRLYEEAFIDNPFHIDTKFRAAKLNASCGRKDRAKELLEDVLEYNPAHVPAIDLLKSIGD